jgi:predicted membrane channel-forming protein YqfA (hemolysin III family)
VPIGVVEIGVEVVSLSLCGTVLSWSRYYQKWEWNMFTRSSYQRKNTVFWLLVAGAILIVFLPILEDLTLLPVPERLTTILGVGFWIVAGGVYLLFVREGVSNAALPPVLDKLRCAMQLETCNFSCVPVRSDSGAVSAEPTGARAVADWGQC